MNTKLTPRRVRLLRAQFEKITDTNTLDWVQRHVAAISALQEAGEIVKSDPVDVLLDYWSLSGEVPRFIGSRE